MLRLVFISIRNVIHNSWVYQCSQVSNQTPVSWNSISCTVSSTLTERLLNNVYSVQDSKITLTNKSNSASVFFDQSTHNLYRKTSAFFRISSAFREWVKNPSHEIRSLGGRGGGGGGYHNLSVKDMFLQELFVHLLSRLLQDQSWRHAALPSVIIFLLICEYSMLEKITQY